MPKTTTVDLFLEANLRVSTQPPQGRRSLAATANQEEDVVSCAKRPPGIRHGVVKQASLSLAEATNHVQCIHAESGGAAGKCAKGRAGVGLRCDVVFEPKPCLR
jgi:hypothetical protein